MNIIAIAGLGWLGLPLNTRLKSLGMPVKGSVSSVKKQRELKAKGYDVYQVLITETGVQGEVDAFLATVKTAIVLIPPGLRRGTGHNHALRMARFLQRLEQAEVEKVILISSTGVYSDAQGKVTENDMPRPETEAGRQLLEVEQMYFRSHLECTIVRFGGLFGGSRNPVRFLAGRENLKNGEAPVNLIHREDCLNIITAVLMKNAYGHIINAVIPQHPSKKEYYTAEAMRLGLEPPHYTGDMDEVYKQVDSLSLGEVLGYEFQNYLK
ncbi:MAG: NAD(P)-dependent oxidoreductase [Cytophagaceae bacterium]|nr:NAD(P)-dependent oxidoreductase [Cytophagaceae bacterium]|tara:strand:- start:7254 stop:8054 length:801 start_codon:yes stop_codon:yes gene_type:complete